MSFSTRETGLRTEASQHILLQACLGAAHVHSMNIVHRDLKPANILMRFHAGAVGILRVCLADFGNACEAPPSRHRRQAESMTVLAGKRVSVAMVTASLHCPIRSTRDLERLVGRLFCRRLVFGSNWIRDDHGPPPCDETRCAGNSESWNTLRMELARCQRAAVMPIGARTGSQSRGSGRHERSEQK